MGHAKKKFSAKYDVTELFTPLDVSTLEQFEATLGVGLPKDYREFLLEWNGVEFRIDDIDRRVVCPAQPTDDHSPHAPNWNEWTPENRRSIYDGINSVELLFGLPSDRSEKCANSLWHSNELYSFREWAPSRFLVIGVSAHDDVLLCLSTAAPDRGEVFTWTIPMEPIPDNYSPNLFWMSWIAPNFHAFWNSIRETSIDEWFDWGN